MAADPDTRLTGSQAARLVGVSRQLIHDWYRRGLLARDTAGNYRSGDVIAAEQHTRNSPHSKRAPRDAAPETARR